MICKVRKSAAPGQGARSPPTYDETPERLRQAGNGAQGGLHNRHAWPDPVVALTMAPVSWGRCWRPCVHVSVSADTLAVLGLQPRPSRLRFKPPALEPVQQVALWGRCWLR